MKKTIGFGIKTPEKECNDKHCPFHGQQPVRGRSFVGIVTNIKMRRSPTVEWERWKYIPKYERFRKARTKIKVHNPECIDAKENSKVRLMETRAISKTKNFVIVEVLE